jgi:uncharacterized protein (TIGR03437 family)
MSRISIVFYSCLLLIPRGLAADTQIFTNFNSSACSQTGSSQFTLPSAANVTHWGVWYDWSTGQTSVAATVQQGSTTVFSGNLAQSSCDTNQSWWCKADGVANATWPAGAYTVTVNPAHMCANSGSSNQGFVYIYGSTAPAGGGTPIAINNAGFETLPSNPVWSDCSGSGGAGCRNTYDGNIPGWTTSGSISGLFQPGPSDFTIPLPAAEGKTVAFTNGGTISQVLGATLQASTVYKLQVDVGRYFSGLYSSSSPPTVQLFAGNTLIAAATGAQPPLGGWTTWTGTYQSSASDPLAGQTLKIVLGATIAQGDFDNVQLTSAAASGGTGGAVGVIFNSAGLSFNDDTVARVIGWDFTPSTPVAVSALGFWASSASGLAVSHDLIVYRDSDQSVVVPKTTVPAGCTPENSFCYVAVSPVTLSAGTKYVIQGTWPPSTADGFTASPQWSANGKTYGVAGITADSRITPGQGRYTSYTSTLAFPASSDPRLFFGPNFKLASASAPTCTYSLSPSGASPGAAQTNGTITVTAGTGCTWTATSNATSWLATTSSGSGSGTVSYTVAANTSTSSRSGTITVGGQTFTVTQAAAVVACSYSISPTTNTMSAQGGSSSIAIAVTAGSSCSWTGSVSSSASSWLHLGSTTSGTGTGTVGYSADANTSTVSRSGTITVAGLTFTLTQAGGASATAPSIAQGGIVNAISNQAGGIAQGSMFSIYGSNLGPAASWTAYQFPIPDNQNGVTVSIAQGSTTLRAYLLYVQANQINAIMPSNTPLGTVQVTVSYNGLIGAAAPVTIVRTSVGINSSAYGSGPGIIKNYISAANQPYNTASTPAKPGQVEIAVGTGLGPIATPDNVSPPAGAPTTPVQVWVGGIQANVSYSGRAPGNAGQDQFNFTVPSNAPLGCSVPLQVTAGGTWSNTVRIAISSDGSHCQDSFNPFAGLSVTGGKTGTLGLVRVNFNGQLDPTQPPTTATLDTAFGAFTKTNPGTDFTYSPITNLPPPGTCASSSKMLDLSAVMGNASSLDPTIAAALDAGAQLTVAGGAGGASGTMTQELGATGPYVGVLGGVLNVSGVTMPPPFLDGGPFTISGTGGADVGKFSASVALAPTITWTNPPSTINRSSPLSLTWSGGDSTQTAVILGGSTDQTSKASGGFLCVAPAGVHSFTVPVNALATLVSTAGATSSSGPIGFLGLMPMHMGNTQKFTAPNLDLGIIFDTTMTAQTVQVQ